MVLRDRQPKFGRLMHHWGLYKCFKYHYNINLLKKVMNEKVSNQINISGIVKKTGYSKKNSGRRHFFISGLYCI